MMERLEDQPPQPHFHTNDGLLLVPVKLRKGTLIPQHSHSHGHTSLLVQGRVRVSVEGQSLGEYRGPDAIWIKARAKHLFEALEDDTIVCCIHREETFEIVEEHQIVGAA